MGGTTLSTRLRQIEERDVLVAQESPPPPTFTVPAFRARNHRGGQSELLKHTYPSGFGKPPDNRPLPTTTKTSTASTRGNTLPLIGPQLRDLLQESREVGVPPCGAVAGRQALNITRVVVGAKDVVDTVGSELVQYAGFSVGPAELSSPANIKRSHHSRPPSPASPSRVTIDGSALRSSLLVEARSAVVRQSSGRASCAPAGEFASPRDESNSWKGRKRIRSATIDRVHSSGPEPWPPYCYPTEVFSGHSSRPSTSASSKRAGPAGVSAPPAVAPRMNGGRDSEQPRGKPSVGKGDQARPVDEDSAAKRGIDGIRDQDTIQGLTDTANAQVVADQHRFLGAQDDSWSVQEEGQAGPQNARKEMAERTEGELTLSDEEEPNGSSGKVDRAWGKYQDFPPSVWSDGHGADGSSHSPCFVVSVGANDNGNDGSVMCNSSVADGLAELVAGKRSSSTLDTERYRGNLSKDATNILRSHLESRKKPPTCSSSASYVSDGHNPLAAEGVALMSPAPPPTPPGQHLDTLLYGSSQHMPACYLTPLDRAPEACYVRTRSDIVLAVVGKKELLECDDDADLRTLKTTARPVRIKADMSMPEGIRAILTSGRLGEGRHRQRGGRSNRAGGAVDGTASTRCRARVLEYFNSHEGAWQLVRSESDWKVLLAAQPSPQGTGVVFQAGAASGLGADFLVAVTPVETQSSGRDKSQAATTRHRNAPGKLKAAALARHASNGGRIGWRYASTVTPRALRSLGPAAGRERDSIDQAVPAHTTRGAAGRDPPETQRKGARPAGPPVPFPGETDVEVFEEVDEIVRENLAGLEGARRRAGAGPGGALWMPRTKGAGGRVVAAASPARRPKKAKVVRLVRHLEAGLRLKGKPGAGGLPAVGSQRVDLPYTKELAKWSYDEILGIPRTVSTVPVKPPEL